MLVLAYMPCCYQFFFLIRPCPYLFYGCLGLAGQERALYVGSYTDCTTSLKANIVCASCAPLAGILQEGGQRK